MKEKFFRQKFLRMMRPTRGELVEAEKKFWAKKILSDASNDFCNGLSMKQMSYLPLFVAIVISLIPTSSHAWWWNKKQEPIMLYDMEKTVFESLNEDQQKHIIAVYNGHEASKNKYKEEIASLQKKITELEGEVQKFLLLEKERENLQHIINQQQMKLDAQEKALSNFLTVSEDLLEAKVKGKNYKEKEKREKFYPKILNIHRGFNSTTITVDNSTIIEISPFEKEKIDAWIVGQTVELTKGDGLVYTLKLKNLDTDNSVAAKIKESP